MGEIFTTPSLIAAYANLIESECISDDCNQEVDPNLVDNDNPIEP